MSAITSSLKPFVINSTDIQFLVDQVNFVPLFDAAGNIIVAWDGTGTVYDFAGVAYGNQGSPAANLAKWGQSYQNFTDLAGTRDVSGYWNNLAPLLAHYGDTGQIFPRMVTADYTGYLAQVTGTATTGPILLTSPDPVVTTADTNVQTLLDSGVYNVFSVPGVTKMLHELVTSGTTVTTAIAQTVATFVVDGHHLTPTITTTTTDTTTTTSSYSYVKDETTTTLSTPYGSSETVSAVVVQTSQATVTNVVVAGNAVTTLSGGELDGNYHNFTTDYALAHQDYTVQAAVGGSAEGDTTATDGTAINLLNVVDYTPRMISRTITTAGVTYDTWANHQTMADGIGGTVPNPDAANHTLNEIYYSPETGEAIVLDWGLLDTVANGGEGQVDTQARLAGSAGQDDHYIGGLNPGVSPSNGFFVLFGQFFDHGLDFIDKGQLDANGKNLTIKIALALDDPLYGMIGPDGRPVTEITINRATVETVDGSGSEYVNHVSPFIDQSQTYGSDVQRTLLLREWVSTDGNASFHAGMNLFDGVTLAKEWVKADGTATNDTLPTLNELRDHILATGRSVLTWEDVLNLRNRDASGHVVAGNSGESLLLDFNPRFDEAHLLNGNGESTAETAGVVDAMALIDTFVKGAYGNASTFGIDPTTHKLTLYLENLPVGTPPGMPHVLAGANALFPFVNFANFSISVAPGAVHDAVSSILMASVGDHYIAGDGRANENFGLTSIHHVFHEEHNYQVQNLIDALHRQDIANPDGHARLHEFQIDTGVTNAAGDYIYGNGSIAWNEEKVFQGAKLIVEMEYQHAAVDQYARNVSPNIQEFVGYSPDKQPDTTLEYSQVAFRFGHSTLRETIDTIDPTHGLTGKIMGYALHDAFLNPELFGATGPGSIILGMTHQQQNEIDEFVTPALNQGLLGQPLDLAAINIARGRDIGIPTLNDFREAIGLVRYTSWNDLGQNMQHPSSLVNFIAAYAFDGSVEKAQAIFDLAGQTYVGEAAGMALGAVLGWTGTVADYVSKAFAFLSGDVTKGGEGTLGFNLIDTWLGGLAEIHQPGGLLGETFDKVFVTQIESLMDGDRFYYLYRLAGQQFGEEVANGQLKDLVERNTGLVHLNGNIFGYADQYVDLGAQKEVVALGAEAQTTGNEHKYGDIADVASGAIGVYTNGGLSNAHDGQMITIGGKSYIQDTRLSADNPMSADYDPTGQSAFAQNDFANLDGTPNSGAESNEVIVGSKGDDLIYGQGGDDTEYGEEGNDILFGGFGIDRLYGGAGNDVFYGGDNPDLIDGGSGDDTIYGESSGTDINGSDQLIGGAGNDVIYGGTGIDKLSAGSGDDKVYGDQDTDPFTHGGDGNDYVDGGSGGDILYGDNGDDIVVGGADQDQLFGGDGDDILRPGDPTGALTIGSDEVLGGDGVDVNDKGFDLIDFSDNNARPGGIKFDIGNQANPNVTVNGTQVQVPSFQIDGVVGSVSDDRLIGDDASAAGSGSDISIAGDNWLIGGSGNDTFQGLGGNDVIVGGSIRLDALIGKYNSGYTHNNDNQGLSNEEQLQDALYQGASHRVLYSETIDNSGLLGHAQTAMFDKHFTELLRTEMFKDTVLGDGGTDGRADTAIYTGNVNLDNPNQSDYTVVALDAQGNVVANPHVDGFFALKITDTRTAADFVDANGQPILDANGNALGNEGTDLLIGVENLQFANMTVNVGAFFDKAPTLDLHAQLVTTSFSASDTFSGNGNAYSRGIGWSGNGWTESGDGNGSSSSGQIHYSSTGLDASGGALTINGGPGQGNNNPYNGASISRGVNLQGYGTAHVSFQVSESGLGSNETVRVYLTNDSNAPSGNDVLITTINQNTNNAGLVSFDVTGNFSSSSRLYFVASSMNSSNDIVTIDNISVTATKSVDAFPGNNYTVDYTEQQGNPPAIASTPVITDADDTKIFSAKAVIRDAVTGDQLNVGGLPAGIVATGSGTGVVVLTSLLGASHADFQTALEAITFSNPGDNPTAADRHVDVTVNDGFRNSAVATTTVHVMPVDDAATALAADAIVTNIGFSNGNPSNQTPTITVAEWMLTSNDTDVDGVVVNSAITNVSGLSSLNHSGGNVSFRDGNGAGGSFTYGSGALSAQVTVSQQASGTLNATSANGQILLDNGSSHTINGGAGNDIIVGGQGNDTVNAGGGDDTIVWTATSGFGGGGGSSTDGRDIVDGGANGSALGDTFIVNGSNTNEVFTVYTAADWTALGGGGNNGHSLQNNTTEIVITRQTGNTNGVPNNSNVIAELRNVEELVINTGGGNDTVNVSGNFDVTHLNYNTIHINDGDGGDSVDITKLTSAHRIVFATNDTGQVIGDLRPQDVVNGVSLGGSDPQPGINQPVDDQSADADASEDNGQNGGDAGYGMSDDAGSDDTDDDASEDDTSSDPVTVADTPVPDTGAVAQTGLTLSGDGNANTLIGGDAIDLVFGGDGADNIVGGGGSDMLFGDGGNDRIFGGAGHDVIEGGAGDDVVFAGDGDDLVIASNGDGDDTYWGDAGTDTLDYAAITSNIEVDLGSGLMGRGQVMIGAETDTIFGFENVLTGSGNDRIIANDAVNVMDGGGGNDTFTFRSAAAADGDKILNFAPGDKIDLSGIDADRGADGHQSFVLFTSGGFSAAGQLMVSYETGADGEHTVISGNVDDDNAAEFQITLAGHHNLTTSDFTGVN